MIALVFAKATKVSAGWIMGFCCAGLAFACCSCAVSGGSVSATRPERILYGWHDDGGPGRISVHISLTDQIADIERGGREIGWCYVATGKEGHDTRPGNYTIMEKIEDKHSNLYGWIEDESGNVVNPDATPRDPHPPGTVYVAAPMPYWMRLTSYGVGMHGGYIPDPGKPASHGCIRMPKEFVPLLFDAAQVGTPVTITMEHSKGGPMTDRPDSWAQEAGSDAFVTGSDRQPLAPVHVSRNTAPFSGY